MSDAGGAPARHDAAAPGHRVFWNGIDARTGRYLRPPTDATGELPPRPRPRRVRTEAPAAHLNPGDLSACGWGVVFAESAAEGTRRQLAPLLEHRCVGTRRRRRVRYRELTYERGETADGFLRRHGVGPGPVDAARVPYYLLLVGGPEEIPFEFQFQLDVQYAVGRLAFDPTGGGLDPAGAYRRYAENVVAYECAAEPAAAGREPDVALFAVEHPDDEATRLCARSLVAPLAARVTRRHPDWRVRTIVGEAATKRRLTALLGGAETPHLLFTACHGLGLPCGHPSQKRLQGALLCQDWPGPVAWDGGPLETRHYLAADDVVGGPRLRGLVTFHFACYSAGTPRFDAFAFPGEPSPLAERTFLARLPQQLLGHPDGGALATIGHVDQAMLSSFQWREAGPQLQVFESFFYSLLRGLPVGAALEWFGQRYAEIAAWLADSLVVGNTDDEVLRYLRVAAADARNYFLMGDPAVRLRSPRP